jgi:hypothetical protein
MIWKIRIKGILSLVGGDTNHLQLSKFGWRGHQPITK